MGLTLPRNGFFELTFSDDDFKLGAVEFIEKELKPNVPSRCRDYDPDKKVWTIDEKFYSLVRQLYRAWFVPPNHDLFEENL